MAIFSSFKSITCSQLSNLGAQPEGLEFKPATCSSKHSSHRQQRLRIGAGNGQKCLRRATRLLAPLLTTFRCTNGNTHQRGELGLREARFFPHIGHGRQHHMQLFGFHFAHGLQQVGGQIAVGFVSGQV